ncbi:hypothetical protein R1sor_025142 [Riccia sorocarpa]|uniref:Transmembrane protein n=1 Tax=Riccia sorocarpa TaxID=122646 RepID=A0ABD3G9R6_9MARC
MHNSVYGKEEQGFEIPGPRTIDPSAITDGRKMSTSTSNVPTAVASRLDKIISNQEVVMTISVEMESELLSALKSVTIDESRSKLKRVHSRLNELRAYVFGSVEVAAELADRLKTAIPELPPTKRQLEDLPSAGDEYENVSVPGDSDEEKSEPRYTAEWNPLICNGEESDYSDCVDLKLSLVLPAISAIVVPACVGAVLGGLSVVALGRLGTRLVSFLPIP